MPNLPVGSRYRGRPARVAGPELFHRCHVYEVICRVSVVSAAEALTLVAVPSEKAELVHGLGLVLRVVCR